MSRTQDVSAVIITRNTVSSMDAVVDGFLEEKDLKKLYDRYAEGVSKYGWSEPYLFSAGETSITCEQLIEIPENELVRVYGKAAAKRIKEAAVKNTQVR